MLVLSRKEDETIIFTTPLGDVEITVTAINGNRVILGLNAPKEIKILRKELAVH